MNVLRSSIAALLPLLIGPPANAKEWIVRSPTELRETLASVATGDRVQIAPGDYPGGHHIREIGQLTVEALDSATPPRIVGGETGLQFSRCDGLTLRHLVIRGQKRNGLNLDDGGERTQPVKGITLENLQVLDIGPTGNHDGIKCSGLENLTIRDCKISGWGGQGIDFVGCHQSRITGCQLIGKPGFSASAGIQLKGGTSDIVVEGCRFQNAGQRPLNIGGSTGLDYFRPPDAKWEGRNLTVRDCVIEGGLCAAAFVGVDGGEFTSNTILFPEKWIFRILQETKADGFAPCRNVRISDNRIVFHRAQVQVEVNVGPNTAPETFGFEHNQWFAEDRPDRSKPHLPVEENAGRYGTDPRP